jgi:hypothetical protein
MREALSRQLSYVLRHRPDAICIALDRAGWVAVDELLAALARHGTALNRAELEAIVDGSDKRRFALARLSGEVFHREAAQRCPDLPHFTIHAAEDGDHFELGVAVLRQRPDLRFEPLRRALAEGWDMMELLSRRIAELALGPGQPG